MPIRIQRKRTKGYNMQAQSPDGLLVVSVCRPGKWGNAFQVDVKCICCQPCTCHSNDGAVAAFRVWLTTYKLRLFPDCLEPLRGKHLACFCRPDQACHADVLLEFANA